MSVWSDGSPWTGEVVGSNPTTPTNFNTLWDVPVRHVSAALPDANKKA